MSMETETELEKEVTQMIPKWVWIVFGAAAVVFIFHAGVQLLFNWMDKRAERSRI